MALFENFPYTNLHELNLDWLISELNNIKNAQVLSVNGETGDVILYQDASVILPEVTDNSWSFFRTADGVVRGITFAADGTAYIMNGDQLIPIYTSSNTPDFTAQYISLPALTLTEEQTQNWNIFRLVNNTVSGIQFDDSGSAYIMSAGLRYKIFTQHDVPPYPVTSVNGLTGNVVLYPDPAVRFPDIIDDQVNYWSIFRYVNNGAYGIQFNSSGTVELITPGARNVIYTAANQPPYPVTSVNSMTGDVELNIPDDLVTDVEDAILELAEPADDYLWGFSRETNNGEIGIIFNNQVGNGAYLRYYDPVNQEYVTTKLLTNEDIPSSAGVSSVNGLTGAVTIYGSNITTDPNSATTIDEAISDLEDAVSDTDETLCFIEDGATATHYIPEGFYLLRNKVLYKALSNIAIGDTLSGTNTAAVLNGGFNDIISFITDHLQIDIVKIFNGTTNNVNIHVDQQSMHILSVGSSAAGARYFGIINRATNPPTVDDLVKGNNVTITINTDTITYNVGSTARTMTMVDFVLRGTAMYV